jgi:L-alanine-DL-glutamate epimerase and related enzymes of enolase superfamily
VKIENIELFYLSMPEILDEADGSQDALIVKVEAGGLVGWGECEASPLTSIANFICPKSHSAANPIKESVINKNINDLNDVKKIIQTVKHKSLMIAQTPHTFSGIEVALLDLLAKKENCPIYSLIGMNNSKPKIAYASVLFGKTPQDTFEVAKNLKNQNFKAIKFWLAEILVSILKQKKIILVLHEKPLGKDLGVKGECRGFLGALMFKEAPKKN